jgi:hypothetical protein
MGSQTIDYEAVIRDLERKRAESNAGFDAAIAAIRRLAIGPSVATQRPPSLPFVTAGQPYRGMTMIEAAMAHLKTTGRAVPNMDLSRAVENGGFVHKSKNFPNTLNSILWRRAKTIGDVRKVGRGWTLTEAKSQD